MCDGPHLLINGRSYCIPDDGTTIVVGPSVDDTQDAAVEFLERCLPLLEAIER
jgi:hypothetical protein